ncbi:MAG TPA: transglutaminase domain-containing protein [Phycisphaerae bacterium]|nr:transglutaminase domain-containing protein [Phycisphaerae bacterium]HRY70982.1 transglutaminase domain-containing protein [Phycisphaerae bacterium]HSA29272.1 transglutaminase domain-containing protein [Phycisphaerae bacterium]
MQTIWRIGLLVSLLTNTLLAEPKATEPISTDRPADPLNPPVGVFADEWYTVMLNGHKCGQMHIQMKRIKGRDTDIIQSWTKMKLSVRRESVEIGLGIDQKTRETIDGHPISYSQTQYLGKNPVTTKATFKDGQVSISQSQFGQELPTKVHDLPPGAMLDWAVYREQFKHGLKAGTRYEIGIYDPTLSPTRLLPTRVEIIGPETVDLFGRKVDAIRTQQKMHMPGTFGLGGSDLETVTWVTESGDVVRMKMTVMEIPIELLACSRAVATSDNDPAELTLNMLVKLNRSIDTRKARKVTYRIGLKPGTDEIKMPDFPETSIQKVTAKDDDSVTLVVTRPSAHSGPKATSKLSASEREDYLSASSSVNWKDAEVSKLADQAAGEERDPRQLGKKLTQFVSEHINSKNLSVGFATASEVARSREGDCSEHGILLAALGRAKGIPTRVVTGLVYADGGFGGQQQVLVGHMWSQFWIEGEWVDLDAALRQTDVDPTHITMSVSANGDAGLADMVTSTWLNLGRLKIEVIETE